MSEKDLNQEKNEEATKEKEEQVMGSSANADDKNMKALKNAVFSEEVGKNATVSEEEKAKAKAKAVAAAKAKAAALAKQKAQAIAAEKDEEATVSEEEKAKAKAKAVAAAKAKAAALAKQKTQAASAEMEIEQQTAPNQALLDGYVRKIEELLGKDVLEEAYINRLSKNVATIVVKKEFYFKVAECLKYNELLYFDYLVELHGTDFISHMEVYVYLYSHTRKQSVVLKVKLNREQPIVPSLVPLWEGANWPECEAYDLLGIQFENHPKLKRILLGEEWVGYPLRKDYEPFDVEV